MCCFVSLRIPWILVLRRVSRPRGLLRAVLERMRVEQAPVASAADLPVGLIFRNRVNPSQEKYFALPEDKIGRMVHAVPSPREGRYAIVTSVGRGMRWTLWRARRACQRRMAKACGPDLPTLGSSAARRIAARRWLKSPDTGESAP